MQFESHTLRPAGLCFHVGFKFYSTFLPSSLHHNTKLLLKCLRSCHTIENELQIELPSKLSHVKLSLIANLTSIFMQISPWTSTLLVTLYAKLQMNSHAAGL